MRLITRIWVLASLGAIALGCGDDSDGESDAGEGSGESAGSCEPGDIVECTCSGGVSGQQVCMAAGDGYWPCECGAGGSMDGSGGGSQSGTSAASSETGAGSASDVTGGSACDATHPLVEGDMRFCEQGFCYCGDPAADPPLDSCYAADEADACCPVDLECY